MASQTIWIVDTHNRSLTLAEAIASPEISVVSFHSTNQLAQALAGAANGAVIANIHENEDFETLEHLSKISLTFPEIPMVLLLPEPMHAAMDWGPRVFNLIKPVSPESILRRLSFLDEHSYPTRGILQKGYLLALLDYCLLQKKHARISIRYAQKHEIEILVQQGKLHSLYIDNQLKNDKILFPFSLDGAEFSLEYLEHDTHTVFEPKFAISDEEYRRFRLELHPFLSLTQQFPPMSEVLQIDDARLMRVLNSLPEQVHSVIRHFDGVNDLFQIFSTIDLRPLETAQRIGYLYFSDVFRKSEESAFDGAASPSPPGSVQEPASGKSSSELASWLLDPVGAARQLENRIRESLKAKKGTAGQFRPHRKTQPGLGALLCPVGAETHGEDDTSKANWGGVNTRMLRESQDFFRVQPQEDPIPGLAPQEIVMEMDDEPDEPAESACGIIDVQETENPPAENAKNDKIILEGSLSLSGESAVVESGEALHPAFHDEPTAPLETQSEEDIARESLSELLSLRAGTLEKNGGRDERFRETKQLQAFLIPQEAMPENGPDVPTLAPAAVSSPDAETTPSPAFDDAPNAAVTPRPEVSVDEPTPVPQPVVQAESAMPEASADESRSAEKAETARDASQAEKTGAPDTQAPATDAPTPVIPGTQDERTQETAFARKDGGGRNPITFQKNESIQTSRGKPFLAVLILAALLVAAYALWGRDSEDMELGKAQNSKTAPHHATENVAPHALDRLPANQNASTPMAMEEVPAPMEEVPAPMEEVPAPMEAEPADANLAALREKAKSLYENYRRRGVKASLRELEKLAADNPQLPEAASYLADVHYQDGRIAKAYAWARKAIELNRDQPLAWWVAGLVAYEAGRKAEYIEAFREYIRLSPDDENAQKIRQLKIRELSNP